MSNVATFANPGQALWHLRQAGMSLKTILDVGIREGTPFLKGQFPKSKHFLFEPMVEWYDTIRENYEGFDYELVEAACSNENGEVEFVAAHMQANIELPSHGHMIDVAPQLKSKGETYTVKTMKMDDFVVERDLKGPFLLKVDVDGSEPLVLEGATETLKRCDLVILEMNRANFLQLAALMYEHGFFAHTITGSAFGRLPETARQQPEAPGTGLLQCDIFFMPRKYFAEERFRPER